MVGASILQTDEMLDKLWEEAQGKFSFPGVIIEYNVRPNLTKEQWKKQWNETVFGKKDYAVNKKGKIIMPNLGII